MPAASLTAVLTDPRLHAVPVFADNYVWVLRAATGNAALVVDPGDAAPVAAWLAAQGLTLTAILITHHHGDHTGGIQALKAPGVTVYGPGREAIAGVDRPLGDGDQLDLPGFGRFEILDVPGHTAGHIAFVGALGERPLLFCGDTLFSAGCGRLFEGTAAQLHRSLQRLAALPAATLVCCTHEYTLGNLRFAAAVEPDNDDIQCCTRWATAQRAAGAPTVPGDLAREHAINPFLRTGDRAVQQAIRAHAAAIGADAPASDTGLFAALRRWKDDF